MKKLILLVITLLLGGCTEDARVPGLEQKLEAAITEISKQQNELNQLKDTLQEVKNDLDMDKIFEDIEKLAYLTPGADGYNVLRYELGVITVKIADIKPYANGSMVTLEFGNPLSATVFGLKATLDWGKVDDKGLPVKGQTKSRKITFNDKLYSGNWTRVPIVLDGVPPTEFGFLRLKDVSYNGIELMR